MKKKILAILMVAVLAGSLAACSKTGSENAEGTETPSEEADNTNTVVNDGKTYLKDINPEEYCTLGEYKGITLELAEPTVTDGDLEQYIQYILNNSPELTPITDRDLVEDGDTVVIDYEGKADGVTFEGGTAKGAKLTIGSGRFIPGFEDKVIGMKTGETKDIDVTFPDPYENNPDLAGKPVVFTVTVNSINTLTIPELTDEYVASLGMEELSTVEDYRNHAKSVLEDSAKQDYESQKQNAVITEIEKNTTFTGAPESMIQRMKTTLTQNLTSYAQMYSVALEEYVAQMYGGAAEDCDKILMEQAGTMANRYIMMAAIAQKEGLTVSDEDLDAQMTSEAADYGFSSLEEYKSAIDVEAYREYMMTQKVSEFILGAATFNTPVMEEPPVDDTSEE